MMGMMFSLCKIFNLQEPLIKADDVYRFFSMEHWLFLFVPRKLGGKICF